MPNWNDKTFKDNITSITRYTTKTPMFKGVKYTKVILNNDKIKLC